jgi:hypothetical protein
MYRIHLIALFACLVLFAGLSADATEPPPPPHIDNISPPSAAIGTKVTITGSGFGRSQGNDSTVTFGSVAAEKATTWTATKIVVTVPSGAKTGDVVVKPSAAPSNGKPFRLAPQASSTPILIPLGALSGSDADLLAQTLSSVFRDFVVTACADANSDSGQPASTGAPGSNSSSSSKHTLLVQNSGAAAAAGQCPKPPATGNAGSTIPQSRATGNAGSVIPKCPSDPTRCPLEGVEASLDRDNFKGVLNSNYVAHVRGFADKLVKAFPHPTPDINVEKADIGIGDEGGDEKDDYVILVPSSSVLGQTAALKTLAQDAAGLKHDFELLSQTDHPKSCDPSVPTPETADELCLANNTVTLSVLNPRDVALHAKDLFDNRVVLPVIVFPLNHSVALLPAGYPAPNQRTKAVEQYELDQQNQKQTQLLASLQSASPAAGPTTSTAPVTTTTTTIKTPAPPSTKGSTTGDSSSTKTASATTSISTSTSTTTQPPAAGASASGQSTTAASAPATGGAPASPAGGAAAAAPAATAQAQPAAPSWSIDNIVRLYDYRDATGIAAAINGMVSYVPNSRPIVQALSDNGANDLIEILPTAAQHGGYNTGDIERAISLLDLPRPQLSLQVWSYQISARVKNPVEPYKNHHGKCPKVKRSEPCPDGDAKCKQKKDSIESCKDGTGECEQDISTQPCPNDNRKTEEDDARIALESVNRRVDLANERMAKALESGMEAIFEAARVNDCYTTPDVSHAHPEDLWSGWHDEKQKPHSCGAEVPKHKFFEEVFRGYLTAKYHDCVTQGRYCIGYYNALDYPEKASTKEKPNPKVANASLGRLLLFVAATDETEAKILKGEIIRRMINALVDQPCVSTFCGLADDKPRSYFSRFCDQLDHITEPDNLRILRAAFLDFFFNYKWTLNYPNDFVPYDLRRSAHSLDDLLQPIVNAFDQDIDEYVQDRLDDPNLIPKTSKAGLISQGMVSVAALSGTQATVSGQVSNYFDVTQTPSLSQVAQSLLAPSGATTTGGSPSLQGLVSTNPYVVGGEALAAMLAPQKITAQLTRGITLTVTPTSLDTASSAELNVNLAVNEPDGGPQSVNTTAVTQDLLDRVASHTVTDIVRVQSLKLFDLSTLSMEITRPQTPTCWPLYDDGWRRDLSYVAAVPFSVPCAVWRSTFGSMPVAGRLFEWPRPPITVDNRSIAIIRATVVPTAMDLGEGLGFEADRVFDPVTKITESLSSVSQLGWRARQFHKLMMQCVLNRSANPCPTLSEVPDDIREPTTN